MPRINVEDELFGDHRFKRLVRKLKNEDEALGMVIRCWRLAFMFYKDGYTIPVAEFQAEELQPIIDCGLAEETEDGVYVKGSREKFAWYTKVVEASKKGGEATKRLHAKAKAKSGPTDSRMASQKQADALAGIPVSASSPSPALAPALALDRSNTNTISTELEKSDAFAFLKEIKKPEVVEFLLKEKVTAKNVYLWLRTYEEPGFVETEILKAMAWIEANPRKRPKKNAARFLGAWLSRAWDTYRKTLPSNKVNEGSGGDWLSYHNAKKKELKSES